MQRSGASPKLPTETPRFDIALRREGDHRQQEYKGVVPTQLSEQWRRIIPVGRPRTGIEVVSDAIGEDGIRRIAFRDLRTGDVSAPWRVEDLKEGSVREYAARMRQVDTRLDDDQIRWWGNIGYLRPMRSQVDLVFRDEYGVDFIYYAARREELRDEWRTLLEQWNDVAAPQRNGGHNPVMNAMNDLPALRQERAARNELFGPRSSPGQMPWAPNHTGVEEELQANELAAPDEGLPWFPGEKNGL